MYQVDINKKSTNKWTCKLCGNKQTLKQVFFEGDSKDCRERVKLLNGMRGQRDNETTEMNLIMSEKRQNQKYEEEEEVKQQQQPVQSKWAKYLSKKEYQRYYGDNEQQQNVNDDDDDEL